MKGENSEKDDGHNNHSFNNCCDNVCSLQRTINIILDAHQTVLNDMAKLNELMAKKIRIMEEKIKTLEEDRNVITQLFGRENTKLSAG